MYILRLSQVDSLQLGDLLALGSSRFGNDRSVAISTLLDFLNDNLSFSEALPLITQYAAPSATGFNVQVTEDVGSVHLILTPVAGYAAGTIILPVSSGCVDRQEFLCNITQDITALTVDGNGATVVNAPTTITANDKFRLKYDLPGNTWYLIG